MITDTGLLVPDNKELLKGIPSENITWRHMEVGQSNTKYRNRGVRYFAIKLDDDYAHELESQGWNIIWRNIAPEDEEPLMQAYFKIFLKFGTPFPIDIYLADPATKQKHPISESDLDALHIDHVRLDHIDVLVRPYHWTYEKDEGVKAQVEEMNIIISQSGLDDDYEIVYDSEE